MSTDAGWLRPRAAAARYHVSRGTLDNWARAGLIGKAKVGRAVFYRAADIDSLLAGNERRRTVIPAAPAWQPAATPAAWPAADWANDPVWQGKLPAPHAAPAARK